jgi:hypothetical protein
MRWLIAKQAAAANPEQEKGSLKHQSDFLKQHLLIWAPTCARDIEKAKGANFYRGPANILRGFLKLERSLFAEWDIDKIAPLEEVRRRYGATPMWRGPTFDFSPDEAPEPPAPSREK